VKAVGAKRRWRSGSGGDGVARVGGGDVVIADEVDADGQVPECRHGVPGVYSSDGERDLATPPRAEGARREAANVARAGEATGRITAGSGGSGGRRRT